MPILVKIWPNLERAEAIQWGILARDGGFLFFADAIVAAALGDYLLSDYLYLWPKIRSPKPLGIGMAFFVPVNMFVISLLMLTNSPFIFHDAIPDHLLLLQTVLTILACLYAFFIKAHLYKNLPR
jgi:hypothetical protein